MLYVVRDPKLCRLCGGKCCKTYPGMYLFPDRFIEIFGKFSSFQEFEKILKENNLTYRVCMGVPIPMPKYNDKGCVFLGSKGCTLPLYKRPCECLALVPNEETIIEDEIRCSIHPAVRYVDCFKNWKQLFKQLS